MNSQVENFDQENLQTETQKCTACGGNMVFDPDTQKLNCPHCGSSVDFLKNNLVQEIDISEAFKNLDVWENSKIIKCENCGAVMTVDKENIATVCPYCKTSHILQTKDIGGVKPNAIYPFKISQFDAVKIAKKWAKSRFFAPKTFKKDLSEQNLKGIYHPVWTFDSKTQTNYVGRVGKHKTRTVKTKNGTRVETYTVWYHIHGTIQLNFDDVTINASSSLDEKYINQIMDCPPNEIKVYEKKYIAGFYANHYEKDIKSSWNIAKGSMNSSIKNAIVRKHNADVVDYINTNTSYQDVTYKYVLIPIWALFFPYKEKNYQVFINGNTGKIKGKSPISWLKVTATVFLVASLMMLAFLLLSKF